MGDERLILAPSRVAIQKGADLLVEAAGPLLGRGGARDHAPTDLALVIAELTVTWTGANPRFTVMTGGGPGTSTWTPAYFVVNSFQSRGNIGFASAAAVMMLVMTLVIFLPLVLITAWQARRREARVQ